MMHGDRSHRSEPSVNCVFPEKVWRTDIFSKRADGQSLYPHPFREGERLYRTGDALDFYRMERLNTWDALTIR
ncbi:hypothetical protein QNN00_16110 [Bacillus velezensis]|nr:hypothetical protein [Bacillus velezensis]